MIEVEKITKGMVVWYGYIEISQRQGGYRVTYSLNPGRYLVDYKNDSYIMLVDPDPANPTLERKRVYLSNYGEEMISTLYESFEDLQKDWNAVIDSAKDKMEKYLEMSKKYLDKKYLR